MTEVVEFTLAGGVRGKERVKTGAAGHSYTPERTVTFEGRLAYAAQFAMHGRLPFEGALKLTVWMFYPIPPSKPAAWKEAARRGAIRPTVKPDWDNGGKLTDALNLIVWIDDKQIVDGHVIQFYSDRPRTVVRVEPADLTLHPDLAETEGVFA